MEKFSIKKAASLKESYYLSSLTEADPEGDAPTAPQPEAPDAQDFGGEQGQVPPGYEGDRDDPNRPVDGDGDGQVYDETGGVPPDDAYGAQEEVRTAKELGRVYELNKLYNRLYAINGILNTSPDEKLSELRTMAREAFDIFRLILNNLDSYKDKIDDVILKFYEFVGRVVKQMEIYFKANSEKK